MVGQLLGLRCTNTVGMEMGNVTLVKRMGDSKCGTLNEILRLREMQRA